MAGREREAVGQPGAPGLQERGALRAGLRVPQVRGPEGAGEGALLVFIYISCRRAARAPSGVPAGGQASSYKARALYYCKRALLRIANPSLGAAPAAVTCECRLCSGHSAARARSPSRPIRHQKAKFGTCYYLMPRPIMSPVEQPVPADGWIPCPQRCTEPVPPRSACPGTRQPRV